MEIEISNFPSFELFDIEDAQFVEKMAMESDKTVYSFKTSGGQNWLQKGFTHCRCYWNNPIVQGLTRSDKFAR